MKKFNACPLLSAVYAILQQIAGITVFRSSTTSARDEYGMSTNQTNNNSLRIPKLAIAVMLLVLFFGSARTLQAQSPNFDETWLRLRPNYVEDPTGAVTDFNDNLYTIYKYATDADPIYNYSIGKRDACSGIMDTSWVKIVNNNLGHAAQLFTNKTRDVLYFFWSNTTSTIYLGRITNLNGTPVVEKQWVTIPYPPGISNGPIYVINVYKATVDNAGNIYMTYPFINMIYKITPSGAANFSWCSPFQASSQIISMACDQDNNIYLTRGLLSAPLPVSDPGRYIIKINPSGIADTTWADMHPANVTNNSNPIFIRGKLVINENGLYTFLQYDPGPGTTLIDKIIFRKVNLATGAAITLDSLTKTRAIGQGKHGIIDIAGNNKNEVFYANATDSSMIKMSSSDIFNMQYYKFHRDYHYNNGTYWSDRIVFNQNSEPYVWLQKDTIMGFLLNPKVFSVAHIPQPFNICINIAHPSCTGSADGSLKALPQNTCGTGYQYLWTPGNYTTDSIGGLTAGTYNVRVVCGTDTVNITRTLVAGNGPAAPTTSNQSLCSGATVADLVATPLSGHTIKWYATAAGGTPLSNSTALINGAKYYASQTTPGGCESSVRGVDSVSIRGQLSPVTDTAFCGSGATVSIPVTHSGNTFSWTATQNGTGIAANGTTTPITFTASNSGNSVTRDTVIVTSSYTPPAGYTLSDGVYAFADTTGSTYLDLAAEYPGAAILSAVKPIGFSFNFFNTPYTQFYISRKGGISFTSNIADNKLIYGQKRNQWIFDASTKIGYKVSGTAPNRKLIISFINLKKPDNASGTSQCGPLPFMTCSTTTTYTADPASGYGVFQIILNETSDIIESAKQSVPSLSSTTVATGFINSTNTTTEGTNDELIVNGVFTAMAVPGRLNGNWIKLTNESKFWIPTSNTGCTPQKDTFAISVLPNPKVDSIGNQQVCPGGTVAAINFTTPITGGTVEYKWTNSNTAIGLAASGYGNIPSFTSTGSGSATITVLPYMLKAATDTCFGVARSFTITADLPPAPTTVGNLVVYTGTKTISQLDVTPLSGGTVNFYYTAAGGTALPGSATVVDDTTYYLTQTVAGCESNPRKQIKVNRIANDSIVVCTPATVANLITTPQPGNTASWFTTAAGGAALAGTAAIPAGQHTYYVEEGRAGSATTLLTYVPPPSNTIASLNALTIAENDSIYYGVFNDSAKLYRADPSGNNPVLISKGLAGESIRYMQYEVEGANKYILYTTQNLVKRRNIATGAVTTVWTSPTSPSFNLRQVSRDVANNKLYVADAENGRIKLVDLATNTAITADSLAKIQFGTGFFTARPFAVCYSAPNTLYFGDFERNRIYRKDLTTGVRTDSLTISQPQNILLLPDGKLLITGANNIITVNPDLTGQTTLVTGSSPTFFASQFNSQNELLFADDKSIKKLANVQSNRVPVTVIVNPTPNVTATTDKVVCNNSTLAAVNFSTTTTGGTVTYSWTNNKTGIGLAASGNGTIASFTAVNNGTAPDTAMIIVTPTITNAGVSCIGVKDTFLIIVNPTPVINPVADKELCNGAPVPSFSPTTTATGGTMQYVWANDNTAIGLAGSGTGNIPAFTATNNGTSPVTALVNVYAIYNNGGESCAGPRDTFMITVNPTAKINALADQVLCNGGSFAAVTPTTTATGGTVTYTWTNNTPGIGLAASGTGTIPAFTAVNNGTSPVTATVIVTPNFANGSANCTGTPDTFSVVINPTAAINAISNKVECNGSAVAPIIPASTATGGTVTYSWTNDNTAIGLASSGTGSIPGFIATNTGIAPLTGTITITPTFTANGLSCTGTSTTFTITVNPPPVFNATADKTVCVGATSPVNFSTLLSGGTAVYTWTNSNTAIGLAASGTGPIPGFTATNTTTAPIAGEIVVYMEYTNAGLTCTSLTDTFDYIVNPVATMNAMSNQVVCNNAATAIVNFSSPNTGGVVSYSWVNSNPAIGLSSIGSGSGTIPGFTAINNGDTVATATITVTPTFTNNGVSCTGISRSLTITVNPTAQVNTITNQVVCNNSNTAAVNFSTTRTGGTTTYSWTNSNPSIGLAASGNGNIAAFTAVNTTNAPITATITVTPTFTNSGVSCSGLTKTFTITVNPTVTVTPINNVVVCNNTTTAAISFSSPATGGTVSYTWTNNNTSIGLAANGSGDLPSFSATNTNTTPLVATITVTPVFTNGGVSCTGTARQFTITVNPTAIVNTIPNRVECNGSVVPAVIPSSTATGGTVTYTWTNNNTAIGLGASGTGSIPSFTATNTTNAPAVATITVTPVFTNGAVSCTGTPISYTITVNPPPVFNATANQAACNGAVTSAIPFTTSLTGGTSTFVWTNSNTAIGLAAGGTGNLPAFTASNNTNAPISGVISVVMTYTNAGLSCTSLPQTFNYVVNPTAKVNAVSNQSLCNRASTAPVTFSSPTTGGTLVYNWVNNTPGIGLAASGTGNIPAFIAVNNSTSAITATITVTPTYSNAGISCSGTPVTFTITVNPTPVANFTINNAAQCLTGNQFVYTNATNSAVSYTWSLGDGTTSGAANVTKTYSTAGTYAVKLVSVNSFGCMDSITKSVTVHPQPQKPVVLPALGNGLHSSVVENSYTWYNNGVALPNTNNVNYLPVSAGYHQVQITSAEGCSAKSDSLYYIPEKNADGGLDKQQVFIYPVPVTNGILNIHFNMPLEHKVSCRLFNDIGQLLQVVDIPAGTRQYKLDISRYPKATYTIRFDDYYKIKRGLMVPVTN